MSTILYWKERLISGNIFYADASRIPGLTIKVNRKRPDPTWPYAVARNAMYEDYCVWHRQAYLPQFVDMPHYKEYPEDLPERADELTFFSTLGSWLYMVGKQRQVRSMAVMEPVFEYGQWHDVRKKRYFVRLCSVEAHRAAFQLYTGQALVVETGADIDLGLVKAVTDAQTESRVQTEKNRASMPTMSWS